MQTTPDRIQGLIGGMMRRSALTWPVGQQLYTFCRNQHDHAASQYKEAEGADLLVLLIVEENTADCVLR